jgi:hypothetical protein
VHSNGKSYTSTDAYSNVYGYAWDDIDTYLNTGRNSHSHSDANNKPKQHSYGHT